jgi:hypothetical protein
MQTRREMKEERRKTKQERLINFDSTGWIKHSPYHYAMIINGQKLHYWPSTSKWKYDTDTGTVEPDAVSSLIPQINRQGSHMTTEKRMHVSLTLRDVELIGDLEKHLQESKAGVIRRSVQNYHEHIFKKPQDKDDIEC